MDPPESIDLGSSVEEDISESCEQDRYLVDLVGGLTYTFEVAPMTLADSTLTVLDTNGLTQLNFADDPELIVFTAPASGTYTLVVAAYDESQLGTYLLTVTQNQLVASVLGCYWCIVGNIPPSSPSEKHGWRVLGGMMGPVQ